MRSRKSKVSPEMVATASSTGWERVSVRNIGLRQISSGYGSSKNLVTKKKSSATGGSSSDVENIGPNNL